MGASLRQLHSGLSHLLRGCHLVEVDDDLVVRVVRTETGLDEGHRQHRVPNRPSQPILVGPLLIEVVDSVDGVLKFA